jgi:tryptophan synthase alpha chain
VDRLAQIARLGSGFLYGVSRLGITGVDSHYDATLPQLITQIHQYCDLPVCMGFGISQPADAQLMVNAGADGYITGSRIIQLLQDCPPQTERSILLPYLTDMIAAGCRTIAAP